MDSPDLEENPERSKHSNLPAPSARWLKGGVIGCLSSLVFLLATVTFGLSFLDFIFIGQHLLFERYVFGSIFYELSWLISIFVYSIVWGVIGALFAVRKKAQVILGAILLILYVLAGLWAFQAHSS